MLEFYVQKSDRPSKKWKITNNHNRQSIYIGDSKYEDFLQHKNEIRKTNYLRRHQTTEDWTRSGIYTAGFWSKWLTWNKPTLYESIKDIEQKFGFSVKLKVS